MFIDRYFLRDTRLMALEEARFQLLFPTGCQVNEETLPKLIQGRISLANMFAYKLPEVSWLKILSMEIRLRALEQAKIDGLTMSIASRNVSQTHPTSEADFEIAKNQEEIIRLVMVHAG